MRLRQAHKTKAVDDGNAEFAIFGTMGLMSRVPDEVTRLAESQSGMVARRQLREHDVGWAAVRTQLRAGRWSERSPVVLSTFTGELSRIQTAWLGVLHAGPPALVGGYAALELHGLTNWHRDEVTVFVDDEEHLDPLDGIAWFRSRRPLDLWRSRDHAIPLARVEPATLLCAAYEPSWRTAQGVLAAVVQQRLTTAEKLLDWTHRMKPLRRAPRLRIVLGDIMGGAQSVAEIDVGRLCDGFGLPRPNRQKRRKDSSGRWRYTDCEWDLPDGSVLVLEVDGAFHMEVGHWENDIQRHRRLSRAGRIIVRCTSRELRDEPYAVAADLRALGLAALCA